jgi:4-hydroxybenzoate polyprenyltransferase
VSVTEAISLLVVLMGIALCLVSYTNLLTLQLSVVGALLTVVYPFMKRVTHLPQVVLGMAFSWSIPMAFAATVDSLPAGLWWLFCANLLWVVVYDTQYAMVDREDDLEVGIKSTAILFGRADTRIILMLQLLCLACFLATGLSFHLGAVYFVSIALVALLFLRHQRLISDRSREACFQAFNESKWIGFIVVAGLLGHYA